MFIKRYSLTSVKVAALYKELMSKSISNQIYFLIILKTSSGCPTIEQFVKHPGDDVSGDGLTSHKPSSSWLMHCRRNGGRSSKKLLSGSSAARGVVVSRVWRRMEALLAVETSVKLIY